MNDFVEGPPVPAWHLINIPNNFPPGSSIPAPDEFVASILGTPDAPPAKLPPGYEHAEVIKSSTGLPLPNHPDRDISLMLQHSSDGFTKPDFINHEEIGKGEKIHWRVMRIDNIAEHMQQLRDVMPE